MGTMSMVHEDGSYTKRDQNRTVLNTQLFECLNELIPTTDTILDVGAGIGHYVKAFRDAGYISHGLDATPKIYKQSKRLVHQADLRMECNAFFHKYDWAICIDVGEHIQPQYERIVFHNLARMAREHLIVSWADLRLEKRGRSHVNCRTTAYVVEKILDQDCGWSVDEVRTVEFRKRFLQKVNQAFRRNMYARRRRQGTLDSRVVFFHKTV